VTALTLVGFLFDAVDRLLRLLTLSIGLTFIVCAELVSDLCALSQYILK